MNLKIEPFILNYKYPVRFYGKQIHQKKSFYLCYDQFKSEVNTIDETKVSKIEKYLNDHQLHLQNLIQKLLKEKPSPQEIIFKNLNLIPEVSFAIKSLYLNSIDHPISCYVHGFLDIKNHIIENKFKKFEEYKVKILKIKIDKNNLKLSKEVLIQASQLNYKLRIEANQSLSLQEAMELVSNLENKIDYFEEPLTHLKDLSLFKTKTNIPIALDENIISYKNDEISILPKALCLKPSLYDIPYITGKDIPELIISSAYESSVGLKNLITWAYHLNPNGTHGLDTFDCLPDETFFKIENGVLSEV